MKWWLETIGIVALIQGVGTLINKILGGSESWFLVRHWVPDPLQIPACIVLIVVGGALLLKAATTKEAA